MQRHTVSHLLNRLKPVETCFDKLIGGSSESVKCHLSFKALCCILSDYAEPQSTRLYVTMGQDSAAAGLPQDKDAGDMPCWSTATRFCAVSYFKTFCDRAEERTVRESLVQLIHAQGLNTFSQTLGVFI